MPSNTKALLQELKDQQRKNMLETKRIFIPDWGESGFEVELKKLKVSDLIEADRLATMTDENGNRMINQEKKNIFLVIRGLEGFSMTELPLLEEYTPAGVIQGILQEILEYSGFGQRFETIIESKKKA